MVLGIELRVDRNMGLRSQRRLLLRRRAWLLGLMGSVALGMGPALPRSIDGVTGYVRIYFVCPYIVQSSWTIDDTGISAIVMRL